jgi:hypothetical protein
MSELVITHSAPPAACTEFVPLDEAVWQRWLAKGRADDARDRAARGAAFLWFMAVLLLAAAVFQPYLAPHEFTFRLVVAAGALVAMIDAYAARQYAFSAGFGVVALIYNLAPSLAASGAAGRGLDVVAAALFVGCFAARRRRAA